MCSAGRPEAQAHLLDCDLQARPGKTASTERNLFVLHVLQLLLGLGAVQPLFWLVSARSWKAFLAVSALCHLYKVWPQTTKANRVSQSSGTQSNYALAQEPADLISIPTLPDSKTIYSSRQHYKEIIVRS